MQHHNDYLRSGNDIEYSIIIEYEDFLTRFDLNEILCSIDRIIENELFPHVNAGEHSLRRQNLNLSYLGITSIEHGSINLSVIASNAVAKYVATHFRKGIDESILSEQLERSGKLVGDLLGRILIPINDWAEKYVLKQKQTGGNVKKIKVSRKIKK
jgi:hypothetical protein